MMSAPGPQKLRFTVHSVSGEDPDYPARELLFHSPQTRGWQTPRFCKFPQELLLRLESPSKVQQIQILSHEFKIATKLEVFVGLPSTPGEDPQSMVMKRLGYLSFDSNERSNYQARELKSVHINVGAFFLKIVVHRCHVNKLNIYNQVGLVALNLIGEPLDSAAAMDAGFVSSALGAGIGSYTSPSMESAEMNLDMIVDVVTAQRIRDLLKAKAMAIQNENYDEAKAIKANIERLKVVGAKIAQLDARKQAAIAHEDYDLAKAIKVDIDKLRAAGESAAAGQPGMPGKGPNPDEIFNRVLNKGPQQGFQDRGPPPGGPPGPFQPPPMGAPAQNLDDMPVGGGGGGGGGGMGGGGMGGFMDEGGRVQSQYGGPPPYDDPRGPPPFEPRQRTPQYDPRGPPPMDDRRGATPMMDDRRGAPPLRQNSIPINVKGGGGGFGGGFGGGAGDPSMDEDPGPFGPPPKRGGPGKDQPPPSSHNAYDDRPLKGGKGSYPSPRDDGSMGGGGGSKGDSSGGSEKLTAKPPKGWPSDCPPAEMPTGAAAADAAAWQDLGGEYVAAALVSKIWQLRDAALNYLIDQVENGQLRESSFRSLSKVLQKLLKDKVANTFMSACSLMQSAAQAFGDSNSRELAQLVEQTIPLLCDKLGDSNPRVIKAARDVLLTLAGMRDSGMASNTSLLIKPVKNQVNWKPVLGTLQLLQDVVPIIGTSLRGDAFEINELMDYVGKAFNSPNADVRAAAVKVAVVVHSIVGPKMRNYLPKDANPKVKEQLDIALESDEANTPPEPPAPPAARKKAPAARARDDGPGPATPQKGKAASRPAPDRSMPSMDEGPPARGKAANKPAGKANAPPPRTPPPAAPPSAEDDPAPFEAELREREKALGRDHPDVAESCTNLAILYNQKGDYRKAQPLYERALKIYEKTYGPDHPEVAHTLTDLAVLQLEQGRDDIGRPLLERALRIQEKHLGPDHPDVVAIRDVLNSDE